MMKLHLNLITLALLTMSGTAAANYGLANAHTDKINLDKWQCKNCVKTDGTSGAIALNIGVVDSDDIRANNAFNGFDDGGAYGLDSQLQYQSAGKIASLYATDLGSEHAVARISAGQSGLVSVTADYAHYSYYDSQAQSQYAFTGEEFVDSAELLRQDLQLQRERFGAELVTQFGSLETSASYQTEHKMGTQSASIAGMTATNVVLPVDSTTEQYHASANLKGANWFTGVSYRYSDYSNNLNTAVDFNGYQNALIQAPSNDALQLMFNGAYQFGRSNIAGRVVTGQMNQHADLVANPNISAFDGEVKTLDINLDYTTLLTNKLRLKGGLDYSDRDNRSRLVDNAGFVVDPLSGTFESVTLVDTTTSRANLGASYRIASGYRLTGDYHFVQKQRTAEGWDQEQTQDHSADVKLSISRFDNWDIALKGGYSQRELSKMDADRLLSGEDNALLRRYNLADRERISTEINLTHSPMSSLVVDFNAYWALDDYTSTEIGLTQGEDLGYDLTLSYTFGKAKFHGVTGMQWINSEQAGSSHVSVANWYAEVEDEFIFLGLGAGYQLADDTVVGLDYLYSDSSSNTLVQQGISVPYDDYFAISHSITAYADYNINNKVALRLEYQFEGFEETDYSHVAAYEINSLVTLGNLNHDYDAHQVMLTLSYRL